MKTNVIIISFDRVTTVVLYLVLRNFAPKTAGNFQFAPTTADTGLFKLTPGTAGKINLAPATVRKSKFAPNPKKEREKEDALSKITHSMSLADPFRPFDL